MKKAWLIGLAVLGLCSCGNQKAGSVNEDTIEEVEFIKGVEEKDRTESPSTFDERYGTPIDDKEGKPKDDLVKDPKGNEDGIIGFDDGVDADGYDDVVGDYSEDY